MALSFLNFAARRTLCIALVLAPVFAANSASYGDRQSPIDIPASVPTDRNAAKFENTAQLMPGRSFTLKNTTGHNSTDNRWGSLKAYPAAAAPRIRFGQVDYTLVEFHFHTPSEHLVDGRLTGMEAHFVFIDEKAPACSSGQLLVIGQRIAKGNENREFNKIFGPGIPLPRVWGVFPKIEDFSIGKVIVGLEDSYRYAGSLTAPTDPAILGGCPNPPGGEKEQLASGQLPEVVSWVLLRRTIQMSADQIARFQALFPNGDARGPQALKMRAVTKTMD